MLPKFGHLSILFVCVLILLSVSACFGKDGKIYKRNEIKIKCINGKNCNFDLELKNKTISILNNYPFEPTINKISDDIFQVVFSCGSPCSNSIFVDLKLCIVSNSFENVLHIYKPKFLVITADIDKLFVNKIFNSEIKSIEIKREFSPVANLTSAIEEVKFVTEKKIYIRYLKGINYQTVEETIDIPIEKFN